MARRTRRGTATAAVLVFALVLLWHLHSPILTLSSLATLDPEFHPHFPKSSDTATERIISASVTGQKHHTIPASTPALPHLEKQSDKASSSLLYSGDGWPPSSQPHQPPPLITFIVLWSPDDRTANYLPNFFASVGANPNIEVLLVKFDKYGKGDDVCELERAPNIPNIREICVPMDEYYDLHTDYMCSVWNCTPDQRAKARNVIEERFRKGDRVCTLSAQVRGS